MGYYNEQQTWAFMCQRPDVELEYRLYGEALRRRIRGGEQIAKRVHPFFINEELVRAMVELNGFLRVCQEMRVRDYASGITLHKLSLRLPPIAVETELPVVAVMAPLKATKTRLSSLEAGASVFA